jgi:hypothetical protein
VATRGHKGIPVTLIISTISFERCVMALDQLVEFLKKSDKRTDVKLFEDAKVATKGNGDRVAAAASIMVEVGKKKGFSFTEAEVTQYIHSVKTEYYTNATVRTLMDAYCSTSCHIGSQIQRQ